VPRAGREPARPCRDEHFALRKRFARPLSHEREVRFAASGPRPRHVLVASRGHHADGQYHHGDSNPGGGYQDEEHLSRFGSVASVFCFDTTLPSL
jgi:hypothetical protein